MHPNSITYENVERRCDIIDDSNSWALSPAFFYLSYESELFKISNCQALRYGYETVEKEGNRVGGTLVIFFEPLRT